jgi:phosphate starvation-inducible PhoH-like protein
MKSLIDSGKMLTLPLAYMRGCTFTNSFVLLDEAQNTTIKQMHLFLTRIGTGTKMVITGDPHQSDLGDHNGFNDAIKKFKHIEIPRVKFIELNPDDVVRHPLISSLDDLYKKNKG